MAVILRRAKYHNGICRSRFIVRRVIADFAIDVAAIRAHHNQKQENEQRSPFNCAHNHTLRLSSLPAKKQFRDSNDTGPSRNTAGGSAVKSSTVEPLRAGSSPPSIRYWSDEPS